jgi:ketosteroid isomerase-like protein
MKLRRREALATLGAALLLPGVANAQAGRVPTVTRLVQQFLELEDKLLDAQRRGDHAALDALLAPDFEMRVARQPGTPIARAEWLAALPATHWPAGAVVNEQMAAHEHAGPTIIVSFRQRPERAADARHLPPLFIVDTWQRDGEQWLLAARYAGPAGDPLTAVPGDSRSTAVRKKE